MEITRITLTHATEAEWLAARAEDLTSTECAALFGASPYHTEFELYHRKTGTLPIDDFETNERMKWGNRLESAIAHGVAEDFGLVIAPFKTYMRIPELRLGSSFDFKIIGIVDGWSGDETVRDMFRQHGEGILEVKNVDGLQFKRGWIEDHENIEAPPHIELQVQHQLEVADLQWSLIAPLVGGNTPKPVLRQRDTAIGQMIREKTAAFWARVAAGVAPTPDYSADADTIAKLYVDNDGSTVDLSDNFHLVELCIAYKAAAAEASAAEKRKKAARAEIMTIIEAHKSVSTNGFSISAGTNKASYRAYHKEAGQRVTITVSQIPTADIEANVPAYRNVRISEAA